MTLLMTILSVLAVWAFLLVLVIGLLLIEKVLESVRAYMERIAMGVRAIEKETQPLPTGAVKLGEEIGQIDRGVGSVSEGLGRVDGDLGTAANLLR